MSTTFLQQSQAAQEQLSKYLVRTPLVRSTYWSNKMGKNIFFKLECLQIAGSFKARGSLYKVLQIIAQRGDTNFSVVTASGGNHGLGVCNAAQVFNLPCHIFLHKNVPEFKLKKVAEMGGTVHHVGNSWDESNVEAMQFAKEQPNMVYVHPFDDEDVIVGQSTIATELFDQLAKKDANLIVYPKHVDAIVCSIGGGGLIAGITSATKQILPDCRIFGVETEGAASMYTSLQNNQVVTLDKITSIAEGLGARRVAQRTFDIVKANVEQVVLTTDAAAMDALRETLQNDKLLIEPSCSCSLAALPQILANHPELNDIVVILCGGNFAIENINMFKDK